MTTPWRRLYARAGYSLLMAACGLVCGCLGGGGGAFQGAGVLRGFVTEAQVGGQTYRGGVEGVMVRVQGTDLQATTAEDGFFILSGVPPGDTTVAFEFLGTTSRYRITVPANSEVDLRQVRLRDSEVEVDDVDVVIHQEEDEGESKREREQPSGSSSTSNPGTETPSGSVEEPHDDSSDNSGGSDDRVDDDSPEPPESAEDEFEVEDIDFSGKVQAVNGSSITVRDVVFLVNGATRIEDHDDDAIPLRAIAVGDRVEIHGDVYPDRVVATRIKLED